MCNEFMLKTSNSFTYSLVQITITKVVQCSARKSVDGSPCGIYSKHNKFLKRFFSIKSN